MNIEKIFENFAEREFLKELYLRKREDPQEGGIQAVGAISKSNSCYKINEEDGYEPHMYSFAGLCSYINKGTYTVFDREKTYPIFQEMRQSFIQGIAEVRITSSPTKTVFAITSSLELSNFQIQSIYVLLLNAISLGFENIQLGVTSKNVNIKFGVESQEAVDILENYLDGKEDFKASSHSR